MKPLLIILTGHAPDAIRARLGDFDHWFRLALRLPPNDIQVIDVSAGQALPNTHDVRAAVISGSAAMVTERLAWSEQLAGWIRHAMDVELPLFGVCYGHQLMAHALGGRVDVLPGGREVGTQNIEVFEAGADDRLLAGLPTHFAAHTTHVQSVLEAPTGTQVLARSARDPHQILRYGPNAVSTQLHPEFSADVMRAYLRLRADNLRNESLDVAALLKMVRATPQARRLLQRFARQTAPRLMEVVA
ncbi:MAG TPA: glutamine amidotransferase [Rhodanobacteraceae bacterium]|nr:glutamine amidotransferase [Rhodanobacteraceae bacterium]